ncbi:MAG: amidohydrolase family protein [Candidatus Aminicenantes bacterium]|jgi:imidazolonepropionase-like amidohydrolase
MSRKLFILSLVFILCISLGHPQEKNPDLVAVKGATIIPVAGDDIVKGTILIKDGLIEAVGKDVRIPEGAKVIDAEGLYAFPGMIDSYCFLGIQEIGAVRATVDSRETGRINPQVISVEALRPDSRHIPISRSNGITTALVVPSGGLIAGKSGLIRLVGYTPEEMVIKKPVALHVEFPTSRRSRRRTTTAEQEKASKQIKELKDLFSRARLYQKRKEQAEKNKMLALPEFDETLESLLPVVNGELTVMISVHAEQDILDAIKFVKEENLKAIFFGVTYGWKVPDKIKESGIPVVFGSLNAMPVKWEDGYDAIYRNPSVLSKAGVKIAFSSQSSSLAKDLPYFAAKAAAFGLDRREALKAVTIYPAEIFGLGDKMGSIEKGKIANIVICDGDILELGTNIKHVFIDGVETDLSSIYTELLEKFKKRHKDK